MLFPKGRVAEEAIPQFWVHGFRVLWPQGLGGVKTVSLLGFRTYRSELLLGPAA